MVCPLPGQARLYTGPMFMKYNAVLRGVPAASPGWLREAMDGLCRGNRYVTKLHCVDSALVELGRLTVVCPLPAGT